MSITDYQSTRGSAPRISSLDAVLAGIAPDGGLYISDALKQLSFDWRRCLKLDAFSMASMILGALLPDYEHMDTLVEKAYRGKFETDELTPLVPVGNKWSLELYRGPTSAFKDVALSMLPQLITAGRQQKQSDGETLILTATSGDTGKAALEGFHDVEGTRILVFFPEDGVSAVQKAQMVTQEGRNVTVCGVRGNFDDCQNGVKAAFAALGSCAAQHGITLSSANSINIGRLAPQLVYYFLAYRQLLDRSAVREGDPVDFVVPTGNFGDILAGYFAKQLGLPVGRLVCASNANRVLTDFFATGTYDRRRPFHLTTSPSMDILVSSNLERLLFLASDGDTELVSRCMKELAENGHYTFPAPLMEKLRSEFSAGCCSEAQAAETIRRLWTEHGYLCDPHTAVAFSVAEAFPSENPVVVLSTASPYKFPAAVLQALGHSADGDDFAAMDALNDLTAVPVPKNLAALREKPVLHRDVIPCDRLVDYVRSKIEGGSL